MDKKYGVYVCTGCGIGDALDISALSEVATEEGLSCQTHPFLCSKEGVELLKKDNAEKGINTDKEGFRRILDGLWENISE